MPEKIKNLFPFPTFPVRLEQKDENKICWFKDEYDLKKHITRYNLKKKDYTIGYKYE
jgi:hypothetical protein